MAKFYEEIEPQLQEFIEKQPLFFVATAPLDASGHVNLSPKGHDVFRVLSPNRIAYLDLTGSGNETSAHIAENQRITFMFCAFEGRPQILRLYGSGQTVLPGDSGWEELIPQFPELSGVRQIIVAEINAAQTSCGYAVPLMSYEGDRETLLRWAEAKGNEELKVYRKEKNVESLDGLISPLSKHSVP